MFGLTTVCDIYTIDWIIIIILWLHCFESYRLDSVRAKTLDESGSKFVFVPGVFQSQTNAAKSINSVTLLDINTILKVIQ